MTLLSVTLDSYNGEEVSITTRWTLLVGILDEAARKRLVTGT